MLSQLDSLKFSRWHFYMLSALGTTWIFDGFEVSMLSLVSKQLMNTFQKTESQIGLLASIYLMGCCTGAILFSCFAFKYGRKDLFNVTLAVYSISVLAITTSQSYEFFAVCRFFTGIGVGGEYTAIFAAVDEMIPPYVRGRVDIIVDGTWAFGGILASIMSLVLYYSVDSDDMWRAQFFIGVVGIIPIFIMRRKIPESPRWLLFKNRKNEARQIIEFIKYCSEQNKFLTFEEYVLDQNSSIGSEITYNEDNETKQTNFSQFLGQITYILIKKYPSRLFLGLVLMSVQAFFYQGIYYTFALQLQNQYDVQQQEMYILMMPLTIAGFMGTVIFGQYFDSIGRRWMITFTYIGSGLILALIGALIVMYEIDKYVYVSLFFVLFLVASPGASSAHLTVSEIFPSEMRSQAMALFFATGLGVGGVISPFFFSRLIQSNETIYYAYGIFLASILMIFAGIVGYFCAIDAEKKPLEQISSFESTSSGGYTQNQVEDKYDY